MANSFDSKQTKAFLREEVAAALGWNPEDVMGLSFQSLRELVRPVDKNLADELSRRIQHGAY